MEFVVPSAMGKRTLHGKDVSVCLSETVSYSWIHFLKIVMSGTTDLRPIVSQRNEVFHEAIHSFFYLLQEPLHS
jgi:hypothetical protein